MSGMFCCLATVCHLLTVTIIQSGQKSLHQSHHSLVISFPVLTFCLTSFHCLCLLFYNLSTKLPSVTLSAFACISSVAVIISDQLSPTPLLHLCEIPNCVNKYVSLSDSQSKEHKAHLQYLYMFTNKYIVIHPPTEIHSSTAADKHFASSPISSLPHQAANKPIHKHTHT